MKRKIKTDRNETPELTSEQLEMLGNRIEQIGEDRSQIEPYDNSAQATALRYAKKNKLSALSIIVSAISMAICDYFVKSGKTRQGRVACTEKNRRTGKSTSILFCLIYFLCNLHFFLHI